LLAHEIHRVRRHLLCGLPPGQDTAHEGLDVQGVGSAITDRHRGRLRCGGVLAAQTRGQRLGSASHHLPRVEQLARREGRCLRIALVRRQMQIEQRSPRPLVGVGHYLIANPL
jgi:hypothetical protein